MPLTVEIKARCANHDAIRTILRSYNAEFKGTDDQVDTYFKVPSGRLKLREGTIENSLVFYRRPDHEGPKESEVLLFPNQSGSTLKQILMQSLGVTAVVGKRREIYFINNVKFHLDTVNGLGTFVEIEAIDVDGTMGKDHLREQCATYLDLFPIGRSDLIPGSYSDLILER